MGAALNGALVMIGAELGLWKALAGAGPLTSDEIAERSGVAERYVREWASAQAAGGYLEYDSDDETFILPPEQAMAVADEDSPVYMLGGYHIISSVYKAAAGSPSASGPARASAGTSTIPSSSRAPSSSSVPATEPTSWPSGSPRSTPSRRSSGPARESPTLVADTAPRPSSWPTPTPSRPFTDSITTTPRSSGRRRSPPPKG